MSLYYVSSGMDQQQLNNRDSITKQHFMDTMIHYLGNLPFDAERFAIIVQRYIQDEEINLYLETILHDYDSGDDIDEVEARGVIYERANPFFTQIFAEYYDESYLKEIIEHSKKDLAVSMLIEEVFQTPSRKKQAYLYTQKIQQAFDTYPSLQARKSMISGAQKLLVHELIQSSAEIGQDEYIGI